MEKIIIDLYYQNKSAKEIIREIENNLGVALTFNQYRYIVDKLRITGKIKTKRVHAMHNSAARKYLQSMWNEGHPHAIICKEMEHKYHWSIAPDRLWSVVTMMRKNGYKMKDRRFKN